MAEKFDEYLNNRDPNKLDLEEQAIRHRYFGDYRLSRALFEEIAKSWLYKSRYGESYSEADKRNIDMLKTLSFLQVREGIYLSLSNGNPDVIKQHFLWAAENAYIPEDEVSKYLKYNADDAAIAFLWRGYALLMLGDYHEANKLLGNVVPFFNKSSPPVNQKDEYYLPKALVPLCEYKQNPTIENRLKALKGLEAFINSYKLFAERLCGYLYYFHLKESFPEVYQANEAKAEIQKPNVRTPVTTELASPVNDERGCIVVHEKGSGCLEVIGKTSEFENFIDKVSNFGDYPAIIELMETYILGEEQEPDPLIEDCITLLSQSGIESGVRQITEYVLEVARCAKNSDDKVILYFDENIE